jgi:hypothetical protein
MSGSDFIFQRVILTVWTCSSSRRNFGVREMFNRPLFLCNVHAMSILCSGSALGALYITSQIEKILLWICFWTKVGCMWVPNWSVICHTKRQGSNYLLSVRSNCVNLPSKMGSSQPSVREVIRIKKLCTIMKLCFIPCQNSTLHPSSSTLWQPPCFALLWP